jgi:hypothetical protein
MLNVIQISPTRVDIELDGAIDAVTMQTGLETLIDASKDVQNGQMLYTISEFSLPTLGAIGVEIAHLPQLFGLLGKFDKCAVLCDAGWLRKAAEIEGAIFPGIEIKSFEMDERAAAEAWLNAPPS